MGPPGAGKSTVAAELAQLLGASTADTDALIEAREGRSIPDIFVEQGEEHFRAVEASVVADALASYGGVLALGGGAVLAEATQAALAGQRVVFLDVGLKEAVRRTGLDHGRPLLALNPRGAWLRLMEARRPIYERLASLRIDTSELTPREVAEEIVTRLGLAAREGSA
ncbi:MAG: ATP-binding protein [Austwickia sp.]|nr:MAG: ATP-binding protein [Austwickia sp.]